MHSFPLELLIALFFGVFMLAQFLYGQLRRRALWMQAQNAPADDAPAAAVPLANNRAKAQHREYSRPQHLALQRVRQRKFGARPAVSHG